MRISKRSHNLPNRFGKLISYTATCKHFAYTELVKCLSPNQWMSLCQVNMLKNGKKLLISNTSLLMNNNTWDLVELPEGKEAIGCKCVFKVKHNSEGEVERCKCRLVAKGYSQRYGVDFEETFAPVVRFSSIRTLLAFTVSNNMIVHQMDVVTAFLIGELQEYIYMQQSPGYEVPDRDKLVYRLKKSLFGLKQASKCWNKSFQDFIQDLGYRQSHADPCMI